MKCSLIKQTSLSVLLGASILFAAGAPAAEESEAKIAIPATADAIWQAIESNLAQLHGALSSGKLETVHIHAYAVRDLVRALPTHSTTLSADALRKVKAEGKFVDTIAERMDQTGDAKDKAGTQANLLKLEGVLKLLRAQYPNSK